MKKFGKILTGLVALVGAATANSDCIVEHVHEPGPVEYVESYSKFDRFEDAFIEDLLYAPDYYDGRLVSVYGIPDGLKEEGVSLCVDIASSFDPTESLYGCQNHALYPEVDFAADDIVREMQDGDDQEIIMRGQFNVLQYTRDGGFDYDFEVFSVNVDDVETELTPF